MDRYDNLPDGAIENIIYAMMKIAIGSEGSEIKELMSKIGIKDEQKGNFWELLLEQISRSRVGSDWEGDPIYFPVRTEEIIQNSLIDIIQKLCDAQDLTEQSETLINTSKIYDELKKEIENESEEKYWNESVQRLVEKVIDLFKIYGEDREETVILERDNKEILKLKDLRNADAGNSFENDSEWVKPWKNIDNKTYSEIRNADKIFDILNNNNKLDKTKKKAQNNVETNEAFISLLMPRYGRRVEIEDLDRNFWVIAQIVDGMSNWIFDNSPFSEILSKLIEETTQLWENILYLWTQIALISQKKSDKILNLYESVKILKNEDLLRYESIPVAKGKLLNDNTYDVKIAKFKFMNKDFDLNKKEVANPLEDFNDIYSDQDLCFISKIKINNYRKNYYGGEWFDKVYFSFLNYHGIEIFKERKMFAYDLYEEYEEGKYRKLVISTDFSCEPFDNGKRRFTPYLVSAAYKDGKFLIGYPFSETGNYLIEKNRETLYCGIKAIPEIVIKTDERGEKTLDSFVIKIYDCIYNILANELSSDKKDRLIGYYKMESIENRKGRRIFLKYYPQVVSPPMFFGDIENTEHFKRYTLGEVKWRDINFSYYLGECISWREKTSKITSVSDIIQDPIFIKLGNFLPEGTWEDYPCPPVPAIGMTGTYGGWAAPTRGDFSFYGIPKDFNKKKKEKSNTPTISNSGWIDAAGTIPNFIVPSSTIATDPNPIPTIPEDNSFGSSDGNPGLLYYYFFDWNNYLPNKDQPGHAITFVSNKINSTFDGLCFTLDSEHPYLKKSSEEINEDFILKQGIDTIKKFLIKVLNSDGHCYQFLYKKPCYFITTIGLVPVLEDNMGNIIRQDVNAICHLIKYLPAPESLEIEDGSLNNYKNAYESFNSDILVKNGEDVLGKIVGVNFINRYDTFYDSPSFCDSYITPSIANSLYYETEDRYKERGLFIKNIKDKNYCKIIKINDIENEYKVNFDSNYYGSILYYDITAAAQIKEVVEKIAKGELNDIYQVSEAKIKLEGDNYLQPSQGAIRKVEYSQSFQTRQNNNNVSLMEKDIKETGFLFLNSESKKKTPFINGQLITQRGLTPAIFGGWRDEKLLNAEYSYMNEVITTAYPSPVDEEKSSQPEPTPGQQTQSVNSPNSFYLINFTIDALLSSEESSPSSRKALKPTQGHLEAQTFGIIKILKNKSDKNAYDDLYKACVEGQFGEKYNGMYYSDDQNQVECINFRGYYTVYINNQKIVYSLENPINFKKLGDQGIYPFYFSNNTDLNTGKATLDDYKVSYYDGLTIKIENCDHQQMPLYFYDITDTSLQNMNSSEMDKYIYIIPEESEQNIKKNAYRFEKNNPQSCTTAAFNKVYIDGKNGVLISTNGYKKPYAAFHTQSEGEQSTIVDSLVIKYNDIEYLINDSKQLVYNYNTNLAYMEEPGTPMCLMLETNAIADMWGSNKQVIIQINKSTTSVDYYGDIWKSLREGKNINDIIKIEQNERKGNVEFTQKFMEIYNETELRKFNETNIEFHCQQRVVNKYKDTGDFYINKIDNQVSIILY